ncbi:aromatic amino acid aminotransferase [Enterovibrio norvegicus]|uniref:amino acid aminotransferase n=1 Tax=Enterovibrio norvegicus TaxID=188144 RepID=UPI000C848990|nr:amino acid aminotransferase [Enterovibrio norvegicus]MCC4798536.1 aspartate/tyrosine/aromatic aminotransferase [Enterovibrio norvegicus]PMI33776.1 aromatic amino acid aminotransferase [Enterovibrio norvegicus]PMI39082.1 aromatic amino acid aminotransferase [Enterovibrio norvegicus]PMN49537.1 aromatic amino acid aminotransferase [Enterovibrio norvegicus]TKF19559.1 aspartate/tyrosine/aromatic aminotransferase [Enterovibrio norvegicus]
MLDLLTPAQQDPILSLSIAYRQDTRTDKMDLGIGVYKDSQGNTPIMQAVKVAQQQLADEQTTKSYVGLAGNEAFNQAMTDLLLKGTDGYQRCATVQTPGASGALRMLADLMFLAKPVTTVWISDPSYVNHKPVMEAAGLTVKFYPYFNAATKQVDADAMLDALSKAGSDDVVLLHGCCHNPTGADIRPEHWQVINELAQKNGFTPFVDIAYQGFGAGLEEDAQGLRLLADSVEEMLIATSCSKNFGLYRERTGAAIVIGKNAQEAMNAKGRVLQLARATYTMPPDHGAAIVETILTSDTLTQQWRSELDAMRGRILSLREALCTSLVERCGDNRFDFIKQHQGMFSMLGLSPEQIGKLRDEFGIYAVGDSRINVAGLKESRIDYLADALVKVSS